MMREQDKWRLIATSLCTEDGTWWWYIPAGYGKYRKKNLVINNIFLYVIVVWNGQTFSSMAQRRSRKKFYSNILYGSSEVQHGYIYNFTAYLYWSSRRKHIKIISFMSICQDMKHTNILSLEIAKIVETSCHSFMRTILKISSFCCRSIQN